MSLFSVCNIELAKRTPLDLVSKLAQVYWVWPCGDDRVLGSPCMGGQSPCVGLLKLACAWVREAHVQERKTPDGQAKPEHHRSARLVSCNSDTLCCRQTFVETEYLALKHQLSATNQRLGQWSLNHFFLNTSSCLSLICLEFCHILYGLRLGSSTQCAMELIAYEILLSITLHSAKFWAVAVLDLKYWRHLLTTSVPTFYQCTYLLLSPSSWFSTNYNGLMVAPGEGRSPMASSDAETDFNSIIIIDKLLLVLCVRAASNTESHDCLL